MDLVRIWEQIMRMKKMPFLLTSSRHGQETQPRKARAVLPLDSVAQMYGAFSSTCKIYTHSYCKC